ELPGLAVIVGVDDVRSAGVAQRAAVGVVARYDESAGVRAVLELHADARTCGVPGPLRLFYIGRDLARRTPGFGVVVAEEDPNGARAFRGAVDDLLLDVLAEIVRAQQPESARRFIQHRAGISASVLAVGPDHLLRRERRAAVGRSLQDEIDLAGIFRAI